MGVGFFTNIAACGVFGSHLGLQMQAAGFAIFPLDYRRSTVDRNNLWGAGDVDRRGEQAEPDRGN